MADSAVLRRRLRRLRTPLSYRPLLRSGLIAAVHRRPSRGQRGQGDPTGEALLRYAEALNQGGPPADTAGQESVRDPVLNKRRPRIPSRLIELRLAGLMLVCVPISIFRPCVLIGVPFLLLFAAGYLAIGLPSLRQA